MSWMICAALLDALRKEGVASLARSWIPTATASNFLSGRGKDIFGLFKSNQHFV